ncbi:MAG: 3-phosphoserine/phosphohydroxythreonine transaminase [Legionella sp.]|nr:3-phosphoserine/phosphohydroxythreonine transaminase [Legionella sp.]
MKTRVFNFGAGPAMLPLPILEAAKAEFLNWDGHGLSILEVGHRTPECVELFAQAGQAVREILTIPENYHILFLGGAARTQFAMIPLNLLKPGEQAAYLISGIWSQLAFNEATMLKRAYCISSEHTGCFNTVPKPKDLQFKKNSAYVYYTSNETINGIRFPYVPQTNGIPLIADMTSSLLSEPIDITQYALVFAGAQKNISNAGLTLVIIRDDLLKSTGLPIPSMLNYKVQVQHRSLYATPPVFNCYLALKMFHWIKAQGGVEALYKQNCLKAEKLYQFIDASDFYTSAVDKEVRSLVNLCFSIKQKDLETKFLNQSTQKGLLYLKGHRLVGGLRASLYNAMSMEGVDALITFMSEFQKEHTT